MRPIPKILISSLLTISLSSCFYSTEYVAKYDIAPTTNPTQTESDIREVIQNISSSHKLTPSTKFVDSDTLAFFGKPYHYFKYWTSTQNDLLILTLAYHGSFGKRKSPPYQDMLQQLSDSLNQKFSVSKIEIDEDSNRKMGKKEKH